MKRAESIEAFVAQPVDHWIIAGKALMWCRDYSLGGCVFWGRAGVADARETLRAFEVMFNPNVRAKADLVLDARAVEGVDLEAATALFQWLSTRWKGIVERIRLQVGVIPEGLLGITLAGILPTLGSTHHPFVIERDSLTALRVVAPDDAERIAAELEELVAAATGVSPFMRRFAELLREQAAELTVEDAARALGVSTRTLQRSLQSASTSFQAELREARTDLAAMLLRSTDDKIAAVAARVGLTEGRLGELIRDRFAMSPAEYRRTKD